MSVLWKLVELKKKRKIMKRKFVNILVLLLLGMPILAEDTIHTQYPMPIQYQEACSNHLPQVWRGIVLDHTDIYTDIVTYKNRPTAGKLIIVDTIYTLDFTVNPTHSILRSYGLPKDGRIQIRGKWYDQPGNYTDTIPSTTGCDSILYINIVWTESFRQEETQEICYGNSIQWHGQTLSEEGIYWDSLKTTQGYDSVYQLLLRVHYPHTHYDTATVCSNNLDQFSWHGRSFTQAGDYDRLYRDIHGCDSVFYLHLVVSSPDQNDTIEIHFCQDQGFSYKGKQYFTEAFFVDTVYNTFLCSSYNTYHYLPDENKHIVETLQHLPGDSVVWHGKWYSKDGIYRDTIENAEGCNDIYELYLATRYDMQYSHIACQGEKITFMGKTITENCQVDIRLRSMFGGDSIEHHQFSFAERFLKEDSILLCYGQTYRWQGKTITAVQSQTYNDSHKSVNGCDSIYRLYLKVVPNIDVDTAIIACNDSIDDTHFIQWTDSKNYTWKFSKHNTDTTIHDTIYYSNTLDCDSLRRHVRIIITDRCSQLDSVLLCKGDSVNVNGYFYSKPGVYSQKLPSSRGLNVADSTYTFRVWQAPSDTTTESVTICQSKLPFYYHGRAYNNDSTGDYLVTLKSQYGCDSIIKLHIEVIPTLYSPLNDYSFCPGDSIKITYGEKVFTKPGDYTDTVSYGTMYCDSIIRIRIRYNPTFFQSDKYGLGVDSTFIWTGHKNDTVIHTAGVYYDKHTNMYGCDSTYMLTLVYAQPFYEDKTIHICTSQLPLIWHGRSINKSGVYWDSLQTTYQMDSIYKLTVRVESSYRDTIHYHYCDGDVFTLYGKTFTTSGVYLDTLHSIGGCDSVICHMVNFTTALMRSVENIHIPYGQSYEWHGRIYNKTGIYYDTIRTAVLGCDSIRYTLQLHIDYPDFHQDSVAVCQNDMPYKWHGHEFQQAGIYWDSCKNIYGLDSVHKLILNTLPAAFYSFEKKICKGSSYNFGTRVLTEPGAYIEHASAANGCDSTTRCILNYAPQYFFNETIGYETLPVSWHGKLLTHDGYFYDSLTTHDYGCDSIYRVYLYHSKCYVSSEEKEICEHQLPYSWHGKELNKAGLDSAVYQTFDGKDSIYYITLYVNSTNLTILNQKICEGESYSLHGLEIKKPGIYRDTMYTVDGCYDITELHLSYYDTPTTDTTYHLCYGTSITIGGQVITQSGTYTETSQSLLTGCDSVTRHIVNFHSPFFHDQYKTINLGEVFIWHKNGQPWPLSQAGTYFDSCINQFGCDSIYRLELTINQTAYYFPTEIVTVCESNLPYVWRGTSYYTDTTVTAKYLTKLGLDSIYTLELHVSRATDQVENHFFCENDMAEVAGRVFTHSGQFIDTITNRFGCDSIRVLHIVNFYPRYSMTKLIELKNGECYTFGAGTPQDTTICTAGTYYRHFTSIHGCDSLVVLRVTTCPTNKDTLIRKDLCEGEIFSINGQVITQSGKYYSYLKTMDGCDSTVVYLVNFHSTFNDYRAVSICHGSSYQWKGHWNDTILTKAGLYIDSIPAGAGCYNTYTLLLSYKNQDWTDTVISLCEDKLPYIHKGQKYYSDTIFLDTLGHNIDGCDSILRWHYSVNYHCSDYDKFNRCTNEILEIDRQIITQAGVYQVEHISAQGEDSIYRFIVNDIQPYEIYHSESPACDSLVYQGKTYLARRNEPSFEITTRHKSVDGCDSIEHVQLTIYTSPRPYVESATIADYETYIFDGIEYRTPGLHQHMYSDVHGCDSLRSLQLSVLTTTYTDPVTYAICQGDATPLEIFGKLIRPTQDTILRDTIRRGGTEPVINTAIVRINKPFTIARFVAPDTFLCSASQLEFPVRYIAEDPTALPDYYDVDWLSTEPFVSPQHASYPVDDSSHVTIYFNGGGKVLDPGYYTYQVTFYSQTCSSKSVHQAQVEVRYPADIMKSKWNNTITLRNANNNAGHWNLIPPYAWQLTDPSGSDKTGLIQYDNNQAYMVSNHLKDGDEVVAILYREGYTKAVKSCPFIFQSKDTTSTQHNPVVVYPTVAKKTANIHVHTAQQATWRLINATGDEYAHGTTIMGDNLVATPNTTGYYLLQVTTLDGNQYIERIIIY